MKKVNVDDFKPHDLRRWASTNANAVVGNPFWVKRYLDHEIGGVAGTYNLNQYVDHKTYVAYSTENKVRKAIGMRKIPSRRDLKSESQSEDKAGGSHRWWQKTSKPGFPIWLWYRIHWIRLAPLIFGGSDARNRPWRVTPCG